MAQVEQPSAAVNGKTPELSASENNTRPTGTGPLLVAGLLAALVIGAGAYVYYQSEPEPDTAAVTAPATSGNTASAPNESAPLRTEGAASSAQPTKPLPQDESRARAIANAARGKVDDAQYCAVIFVACEHTQVGERMFDFLTLEKSQAAVYPISNAVIEERMLEHTRLGVRAV